MNFRKRVGALEITFYFCDMKMFFAWIIITAFGILGNKQMLAQENSAPSFDADSIAVVDAVDSCKMKSSALSLPLVLPMPPTACWYYPYGWRGYGLLPWHGYGWSGGWLLHEGFNAKVDLSMSSFSGRNIPNRVGFGQNIALAYAKTLNTRWSVAVGVYGYNLDWGQFSQQDAGVSAVVRYRANEWLNLYGYASQKITSSSSSPLTAFLFDPYGMRTPETRVGAAAEIKLGKHALLNVSVDWQKYDTDDITPLMERPKYKRGSY